MSAGAQTGGGERGGPVAQRIGWGLGVGGFLLCMFLPGLPLDPLQRKVAGVTVLTAALWLTVAVPVAAASLVPAALFPLLGVLPAREVAPIYLRDLVMLFLGAFIVALGLERWGVHRRIALAVVDTIGSSRRRLVLGFMGASAFLSMWINNTATTLLMLPIVGAVLARADAEDEALGRAESGTDPRFGWCLLLGVAYAASVGGMGTPVGTAPNQEFLGQFQTLFPDGPRLTFGDWLIAFAPLVLLFVPVGWLLLTRVIYRFEDPGGAAREAVAEERAALGRMSTPERRMAAAFASTALLWVFRADIAIGSWVLPGWGRLALGPEAQDPAWYAQHKGDISDATVAVTMALLLFVIPSGARGGGRDVNGDGEPGAVESDRHGDAGRRFLMDWKTAARLPWEVLLLLGGGFCLAHGLKVSGLDGVLGAALAPYLEGHSSWMIVAMMALLVSLLTEVTSNTATTAVLLPILASAAVTANLNPLLVMLPATLAASAAFMMPVATPPNAVVFATRRIPVPAMARAGVLLNIAMVILIVLVFEFWAKVRLGIEEGVPAWAR